MSYTPTLVRFRMKALAAVPGESRNGRLYSREVLKASEGQWPDHPVLMDHDLHDVHHKSLAWINKSTYGVDRTKDGRMVEGLWLEGTGMAPEDLFEKMAGAGNVPSIIRSVSIGAEGDAEPTMNSEGKRIDKIKSLIPHELSVVAIPGIPDAHIAELQRLEEAYRKGDLKVDETSEALIQESKANQTAIYYDNSGIRDRRVPLPTGNESIMNSFRKPKPFSRYVTREEWNTKPVHCDVCGTDHPMGELHTPVSRSISQMGKLTRAQLGIKPLPVIKEEGGPDVPGLIAPLAPTGATPTMGPGGGVPRPTAPAIPAVASIADPAKSAMQKKDGKPEEEEHHLGPGDTDKIPGSPDSKTSPGYGYPAPGTQPNTLPNRAAVHTDPDVAKKNVMHSQEEALAEEKVRKSQPLIKSIPHYRPELAPNYTRYDPRPREKRSFSTPTSEVKFSQPIAGYDGPVIKETVTFSTRDYQSLGNMGTGVPEEQFELTVEDEELGDLVFSVPEEDFEVFEGAVYRNALMPWEGGLAEANWIKKAIKHPGALRKQLGVSGDKPIPASALRAAAKKPGTLGRRARLALTLIKMHRGKKKK